MIKKNKLNIILSSIIILLPILIGLFMWEYLPEEMAIYWGITGNVKGLAGKVFAVFGVPFIFLITHFICLGFILFDKKQKGNKYDDTANNKRLFCPGIQY